MKKILLCIILLLILISIFFSGCTTIDQPSNNDLYYDSSDLHGCWMFEEIWLEETERTSDCSEYENHGTIHHVTQESNTILGNTCTSFNGTDSFINISGPQLNLEYLSVEAWVKSATPGEAFSYILSKGSQNCNRASYAFYTDSNNGICFYVSDETQTLKSPNPGSSLWDNTWHHITGTYDGEIIRLFVDGAEIQQGNHGNINISYNLSTGSDLIIGNYIGSCQLPYTGCIDNVMIWNKTLTSDEIYQHYLLGIKPSTIQQNQTQYLSFQNARSYLKTYLAPFNKNDILAIKGKNLSLQNSLLLTTIASQMENTQDISILSDSEMINQSINNFELLVCLGSEKTNLLVENIKNSHDFIPSSTIISTPLILEFGTHTTTGQDILIAYTVSEKENLKNLAAEKSPLSSFIDKKYIPAVATSVSVLFLYLWSIFGNTITEFIFDFISEHIAERKIKKLRKYEMKRQVSKNKKIFYESVTLLLAVVIFSIAMSWTWSDDFIEFLSLFTVNLLIISMVFILREAMRLYLSKKYEINTAHIFWPFGSLLTLGSTILGNTFSLASFTMLSNEENQRKFGRMYYQIFKVLFVICLIMYGVNFIYPSVYFQMFYVFIIMSLLIDMTPCEPMDGLDVKKWNKKKWMGFYIIVIICYIFMNFSITSFLLDL